LRNRSTGLIIDEDGSRALNGRKINVEYLVDGAHNGELLFTLKMDEIYKIEVFKSSTVAAMYGSQNVSAVVQVFTKWDRDGFVRFKWGQATIEAQGFRKPAQFYSPKYTLENIRNPEPDFRPTLFWSPSVQVNEGKTSVEFSTCDNLANYIIFVEGISKEGKILFGSKQFSVANFNPAAQK
jgi:hypothetical protein